jgi:hypothetical protein
MARVNRIPMTSLAFDNFDPLIFVNASNLNALLLKLLGAGGGGGERERERERERLKLEGGCLLYFCAV